MNVLRVILPILILFAFYAKGVSSFEPESMATISDISVGSFKSIPSLLKSADFILGDALNKTITSSYNLAQPKGSIQKFNTFYRCTFYFTKIKCQYFHSLLKNSFYPSKISIPIALRKILI
jgi:hypothetical protein